MITENYGQSATGGTINKKYFLFIIIFFIFYCLFLSWSFLFQNVDDAYISYRYGKNLMSGYGLVYNKGEYVEGYTNFLWTVITAPFTTIKSVDISIFALSIGLIVSILNIYILTQLSRQFSDIFVGMPLFIILLPAVFFVLDDSIAFWAIGGMEFPMYTLFILASAYFYFRINLHRRNAFYLVLFLILCTLTRPEGNMIFAITVFHFILFRKQITDFKKKFLQVILIYSFFVIVYYGFKFFYYGQILPNTFYAKGVSDISMNMLLGFKYLALCIGTRLYLFIFILFIPFKKEFGDFKQSYLVLFSFVYVLYLLFIGGDWMFANRFFVPILPFLYLLSTIGIVNAIIKLKSATGGMSIPNANLAKNALKIISVTVSTLLFIITLILLEYNQLIIKDENYNYELQWAKFGMWLKMNVPSDTKIAVGPAGKIPYYSELYTIDMWGLNDVHIAKTFSKRLQAGHKKYDFDYVLSYNPEFVIGYAGFTDEDMPSRYEKFNAPEEEYKSIDVVFRLKPEYRNTTHEPGRMRR